MNIQEENKQISHSVFLSWQIASYIYLVHAQLSKLKKPFVKIVNTFTWALNNLSDFVKYLKSVPHSNISFIFHYTLHQCFEYFFSSKLCVQLQQYWINKSFYHHTLLVSILILPFFFQCFTSVERSQIFLGLHFYIKL